jgi:hypothetical protein
MIVWTKREYAAHCKQFIARHPDPEWHPGSYEHYVEFATGFNDNLDTMEPELRKFVDRCMAERVAEGKMPWISDPGVYRLLDGLLMGKR